MGDPIPKGNGQFWGKRSGPLKSNETLYGAMCKNGWTDRHAVLDKESGEPAEHVLDGGADLPEKKAILGVVRAIQRHWQGSFNRQ